MNLIKNRFQLIRNKLRDVNLNQKCTNKTFEQNKTLIELVSKNQETRFITSVSNFGFRLNNGLFAIGPIVIFNEILLSWNIKSVKEINPSSLSLFRMFVPKFEVIVLGVGDNVQGLHPDLIPWLSRNRVPYEIHNSKDAGKLYNTLAMDKRNVAAALVPPTHVTEEIPEIFETFERMLEAKVKYDLSNEAAISKMFNKYQGELFVRLRNQFLTKEQLKAQIVAKNLAYKERNKTFNFEKVIEQELKAIKEEERELEEKEPFFKKSIFKKKKQAKPSDDKKLIE